MGGETKPCPTCGAPCNTRVNMRGGDYGWSSSDEERTVYTYAHPTPQNEPAGEAVAWLANDGTGRVIDAKAKASGQRAQATKSATEVYSIPLYPHPQQAGDDALRRAGDMLANCAYNLAPRKHLTDVERRSLDESRKAWDAALSATAPAQQRDATDAEIAEWAERHDLSHAIRGTDARAAFEDAQTFVAAHPPAEGECHDRG